MSCGNRFKINSKTAGKIIRYADKKGIDLGRYERVLIAAIVERSERSKSEF